MMYTIVLALVAGASASPQHVEGISCYSDGSCPWYCIGCACCGGTCWFGAGITHCKNEECEICKATAAVALTLGSEPACDAGADAACMAAGGGFVDPIADALCPVLVVPLCHEIFGSGIPPSAEAACDILGYCSSDLDAAVKALSNRFEDETGRRNGFAYAVCESQDFDWIFGEEEEDVYPNCVALSPETHSCDTTWMKQNCAGTCKRCPGARTRCQGSKDDL